MHNDSPTQIGVALVPSGVSTGVSNGQLGFSQERRWVSDWNKGWNGTAQALDRASQVATNLVQRHPVRALAGSIAAGWLFAKLVQPRKG